MKDLETRLVMQVYDKLMKLIDENQNVALREKIFTAVTKSGKEVQVQLVVTDTDFLDDFVTEEMQHYNNPKEFQKQNNERHKD